MIASSWLAPAPTTGGQVWSRLAALVDMQDVLIHGSRTPGLAELSPRAPIDRSPDDFSKRTAVFATEDPTWAIAYAIKTTECRSFLNACFYPGSNPRSVHERRLFLSYAARADGTAPTGPGVVYAVPRSAFVRMPTESDPNFGVITECQWASDHAVPVVAEVPVLPADLPMATRLHDHDEVQRRVAADADGFPWIDDPQMAGDPAALGP